MPPRLAHWLLMVCLSPGHDAVVGDLVEEYHDRAAFESPRRAGFVFWAQTLWAIPSIRLNDLFWGSRMLKNYLLLALRNLRRNKAFSAINIFGLAVSMSVCLLVLTLVRDQQSYDRFHPDAERVYRVTSEVEEPFGRFRMATSPGPLAAELQAQLPGVRKSLRMRRMGGNATHGEQTFALGGLYAEPSFFDLFDFPLAQGDAVTALDAPYALVLTAEAAEKFFGTGEALGKVLHREGLGDFIVTGVLAPLPSNTHLRFDALASFSTLVARNDAEDRLSLDDWAVASAHYTYLLLGPEAAPEEIAAQANVLLREHHPGADRPPAILALQPLTNINLGPDLSNQIGPVMPLASAYFLFVFAGVLLLIALFNYISLTVARSVKRAQEIGIRKVVGAQRSQIVVQFLSEAIVVAVLALGLAGVLLAGLLPGFNSLHGFQEDLDFGRITLDPFRDAPLALLFILFAVGVGVLAGLYPAFKMASFAPTRVLKKLAAGRGSTVPMLRKALIVFQFSLAIIAIITTTVVYQQTRYVLRADYGFGEEQLLSIDLQEVPYETLRNELTRLPGVGHVAATSDLPSAGSKTWTDIQAASMDEPMLIQFYAVDAPFLDQFRIELLAGRTFSATAPEGDAEPILLTKKAVAALGLGTLEEAIGQELKFETNPESLTAVVLGVVDDFYARGFERGYTPVLLRHRPERYRHAVVRLQPGDVQSTLAAIQATWKTLAPTIAFQYAFYDDQIAQQYVFIRDLVKFLGLLAGFIILIACLGLLGIASYTAERRVQEVGIRKALGADVRSVVLLLSGDYIRLLVVAIILATPLAFLLNRALLQGFANQVGLNVWVFLAGILPTLALALLTVGSQTIRAALTNPVETLRQE